MSPVDLNGLIAELVQTGLDGSAPLLLADQPRGTLPSEPGLRTWSTLAAALNRDGLMAAEPLQGLSITALADPDVATTDLTYPSAAQAAELDADRIADIGRSQRAVAAIDAAVLVTDAEGSRSAGVLQPLANGMFAGASAGLRDEPTAATAWLSTVTAVLDGITSRVYILPGSYTLTSTSSPLILTVRNDLPFDVSLKIDISNAAKVGLELDSPEVQIIPASRPKQVELPAKVNLSGTYPVQAQLLTQENGVWGSPTVLNLKSTAYGTFTVTMMIVAGAVLLITVAWRIRQRFRERADRLDAESGTESAGEPGERA